MLIHSPGGGSMSQAKEIITSLMPIPKKTCPRVKLDEFRHMHTTTNCTTKNFSAGSEFLLLGILFLLILLRSIIALLVVFLVVIVLLVVLVLFLCLLLFLRNLHFLDWRIWIDTQLLGHEPVHTADQRRWICNLIA